MNFVEKGTKESQNSSNIKKLQQNSLKNIGMPM